MLISQVGGAGFYGPRDWPRARGRAPSRKFDRPAGSVAGLLVVAQREPDRRRRRFGWWRLLLLRDIVALRERGAQGLEEQPQAPPEGGRRWQRQRLRLLIAARNEPRMMWQ